MSYNEDQLWDMFWGRIKFIWPFRPRTDLSSWRVATQNKWKTDMFANAPSRPWNCRNKSASRRNRRAKKHSHYSGNVGSCLPVLKIYHRDDNNEFGDGKGNIPSACIGSCKFCIVNACPISYGRLSDYQDSMSLSINLQLYLTFSDPTTRTVLLVNRERRVDKLPSVVSHRVVDEMRLINILPTTLWVKSFELLPYP